VAAEEIKVRVVCRGIRWGCI